jgi:hypothetical protein
MRISVVRLKSGDIHVNITVKAPAGGRYDTDIQKVKQKYIEWRRKTIFFRIAFALAWSVWMSFVSGMEITPKLEFGNEFPFNTDWYQAFVHGFLNIIFTWQGWIGIGGLVFWWVWGEKFSQNRAHFECPFSACNEEIRIYEPWECPKCRDDKETLPGLWGTFWDQCRKKHKLTSYQCPSCKNVFELIPDGRTDKFAKLLERLQPRREVAVSNVQPIHSVQTEYIPRDNNRFF